MRRMLIAVAALALATPALAADKKIEDAVAKAESQIAKGRPEEAEKTMQKLVQQVPTAEANAALARIEVKIGNMDAAAAAAAEAGKLVASAPPDVKADVLCTMAELDLQRGTGKDAVTHAQEAVAAASTPATLAMLAKAQARVGDPAALATAQKAVDTGAQQPAPHEAMGRALLAQQRGDDAATAFRKALELDPKRASARAGLAAALVQSGKAAESVTEARKAVADDPKSGESFAVLGTALLAAGKDTKEAWSDAIAEAQQGAFLNPRNPVVQVAVGRIFEAAGNYDQAGGAYKKALDTDPAYAPAQLALLDIQSRKGDVDNALKLARDLAQQQPQNSQVQLMLGRLLARKGSWADAVEPLEKAAKAMPTVAEAHALLGTAYQFVGQSDDALEAYKKAMPLAPNNNDYRTTYGLLLGLNKQHEAGIAELKKVTSSPGYKDAAAWVNLGWLYRDIDPPRAEESLTAYQKALQIDPKNSPAALGLGWAALVGKKYDEAIAAFTKSVELDKGNAVQAYNGIGWAHYFKKDLPQAKAALEKAKAAGRGDARLANSIERTEKGQAESEEEARRAAQQAQRESDQPDVGTLCNQIQRGSPAARRGAAIQLGRMGSAASECLVYAAVNDKDWGVRQAAITSLGNLGAAAGRQACIQLQGIARTNPYEKTIATPQEMQDMVRYEDLRRAARAAIAKIGC